ncbi:MAG: exosortase/archaeosortase family protein [Opitutaceae bacterium]
MTPETTCAPSAGPGRTSINRRLAGLAVVAAVTIGCFGKPLYELARFCLSSDLFSYIPLIPLISLWLVWTARRGLRLDSEPTRRLALFPLAAGILLLAAYYSATRAGWRPDIADYLALMTASLLSLLLAGCFLFLGTATLRAAAFPAAFLIFAVPLPARANEAITHFLQYRSADVAYVMFIISGTPILRQGILFHLPGFNLEVDPECSGIHSSLILLVTAILAGHLLLRTLSRRVILAFGAIAISLLRNGLRILIVGQLCVHIGPEMIDSYIHRHGGPIFFALSLIPLYLLLIALQRSEPSAPGRISTEKPI